MNLIVVITNVIDCGHVLRTKMVRSRGYEIVDVVVFINGIILNQPLQSKYT